MPTVKLPQNVQTAFTVAYDELAIAGRITQLSTIGAGATDMGGTSVLTTCFKDSSYNLHQNNLRHTIIKS